MKRFLPMALSLFLCHCGTEVGNGIAPEPRQTGSTGTPTSAPGSNGDTVDDARSPEMSYPHLFASSFLAACASPFAESMEGTFVDATASRGFTVTVESDGKKSIRPLNASSIFVTITGAPNVSPYAIEALASSPQVSCGPVTTTTLNDGAQQRSVTLSNGDNVQWTLNAGKVISLSSTREIGVETWTRKVD